MICNSGFAGILDQKNIFAKMNLIWAGLKLVL
jgi:hypothetical protein